jgi:hypothetical protein
MCDGVTKLCEEREACEQQRAVETTPAAIRAATRARAARGTAFGERQLPAVRGSDSGARSPSGRLFLATELSTGAGFRPPDLSWGTICARKARPHFIVRLLAQNRCKKYCSSGSCGGSSRDARLQATGPPVLGPNAHKMLASATSCPLASSWTRLRIAVALSSENSHCSRLGRASSRVSSAKRCVGPWVCLGSARDAARAT